MLQRLAPLVLLFVLALGLPPLAAQEAGTFTVSGVEVDVTAGTALDAREQAFAEGQRKALGQLLQRLGVEPGQLDPATLSDTDLARLMQGFQVEEENASTGRYVATLTYHFRAEEVRELLRSRAIEFAAVRSKPLVVIPVYRSEFGPRLWDSPNPWLDAWLNFSGDERLVPIAVPFGDLEDVRDITVEEALSGNREALRTIAERYDAGGAIVAVAEPQGAAVNVTVDRYDIEPGAMPGDASTTFTVDQGADEQALLAAAVEQVTVGLEDAWRAQARVQSGERNTLALLVPLEGSGESWFAIQSRLRRVPTVVESRILSLSPREAILEIDYIGNEQQFRLALAQQDLTIEQGFFAPQLRLAGAAQ